MTLNRSDIMTAAWKDTREQLRMMAVWDADKAAPRSINLATVTEIRLDGLAHAYEVAA